MGEKLLEIKDYCVTFTVDKVKSYAVNHINLSVDKGEVLGLVGETGAGKTTTALSVMGLLPKYGVKTSGEIWFNGKKLTGMKEKEYRKIRGEHISMIFQDPMTSLNPVFRVGDQIADVIKIHNPKMSQLDVNAKVDEIMRMVGISSDRKWNILISFPGDAPAYRHCDCHCLQSGPSHCRRAYDGPGCDDSGPGHKNDA